MRLDYSGTKIIQIFIVTNRLVNLAWDSEHPLGSYRRSYRRKVTDFNESLLYQDFVVFDRTV
jgi:hypothetical protein